MVLLVLICNSSCGAPGSNNSYPCALGSNFIAALTHVELLIFLCSVYTVQKVIDFPRYNAQCSGENDILRGIFHAVSLFPLHFVLYRGNFD